MRLKVWLTGIICGVMLAGAAVPSATVFAAEQDMDIVVEDQFDDFEEIQYESEEEKQEAIDTAVTDALENHPEVDEDFLSCYLIESQTILCYYGCFLPVISNFILMN